MSAAAGRNAFLRKEYRDSGLEGKISFELYKEFIAKKLYAFDRAAEKLKYDLKREIGALAEHKNFEDIMDYIEDNHQLLYRIVFGCDEEGDEYGDEEDSYSPGSNTNTHEEESDSSEDEPSVATNMGGGARRRRRTAKRRYRITRKKHATK